jgi:hypothetical protein
MLLAGILLFSTELLNVKPSPVFADSFATLRLGVKPCSGVQWFRERRFTGGILAGRLLAKHSPRSAVGGLLPDCFSPSRGGAKEDSRKVLFATLRLGVKPVPEFSGSVSGVSRE